MTHESSPTDKRDCAVVFGAVGAEAAAVPLAAVRHVAKLLSVKRGGNEPSFEHPTLSYYSRLTHDSRVSHDGIENQSLFRWPSHN